MQWGSLTGAGWLINPGDTCRGFLDVLEILGTRDAHRNRKGWALEPNFRSWQCEEWRNFFPKNGCSCTEDVCRDWRHPPTVTFPSLSLLSSRGSRWVKWEGHNTGEKGWVSLSGSHHPPPSWCSWWSCCSYLTSHTPSSPFFLEGFRASEVIEVLTSIWISQ